MPSRGSPNGARHIRPQPDRTGRDRPEQVVVIDWNGWSSSIGIGGSHHPVRAHSAACSLTGRDPARVVWGVASCELCAQVNRWGRRRGINCMSGETSSMECARRS